MCKRKVGVVGDIKVRATNFLTSKEKTMFVLMADPAIKYRLLLITAHPFLQLLLNVRLVWQGSLKLHSQIKCLRCC